MASLRRQRKPPQLDQSAAVMHCTEEHVDNPCSLNPGFTLAASSRGPWTPCERVSRDRRPCSFIVLILPAPPPPLVSCLVHLVFHLRRRKKIQINVALKPNRDGLLISLFGEILLTQTSLNSKTKAGEPAEASFHFLNININIYI